MTGYQSAQYTAPTTRKTNGKRKRKAATGESKKSSKGALQMPTMLTVIAMVDDFTQTPQFALQSSGRPVWDDNASYSDGLAVANVTGVDGLGRRRFGIGVAKNLAK